MKQRFAEYGVMTLEIVGGVIGMYLLFTTFIGVESPISAFVTLVLEGLL